MSETPGTGKHSKCQYPDCADGVIWTASRGWIQCPYCRTLHDRDAGLSRDKVLDLARQALRDGKGHETP